MQATHCRVFCDSDPPCAKRVSLCSSTPPLFSVSFVHVIPLSHLLKRQCLVLRRHFADAEHKCRTYHSFRPVDTSLRPPRLLTRPKALVTELRCWFILGVEPGICNLKKLAYVSSIIKLFSQTAAALRLHYRPCQAPAARVLAVPLQA